MDKEGYFRKMNEKGFSMSNPGKNESVSPDLKEKEDLDEGGHPLISPLFIELAHQMKNTLSSIRNITQLSRGKFRDLEFEDYFHRSITDDIEKIETVINGLLNYVKVSTPMVKSNTVHSLLDEIVERHREQIEEKRIRLFKKFERELPETAIHEEQLRYVVHSVFQYAITSIPSNGSIALLTKIFDPHKTTGEKKGLAQKDGRYVEILIGFTGYKKPVVSLESGFRHTPLQRDESMDLILRLVKEIIQKNKGAMRFDIDEKKPQTFVSLIFPIERRKIVYYPKTSS